MRAEGGSRGSVVWCGGGEGVEVRCGWECRVYVEVWVGGRRVRGVRQVGECRRRWWTNSGGKCARGVVENLTHVVV